MHNFALFIWVARFRCPTHALELCNIAEYSALEGALLISQAFAIG